MVCFPPLVKQGSAIIFQKSVDIYKLMRYSMKYQTIKQKQLRQTTTMQTTSKNLNTPSAVLASWQRARSDEEISDLISRRTELLGEIDDDDFELAAI